MKMDEEDQKTLVEVIMNLQAIANKLQQNQEVTQMAIDSMESTTGWLDEWMKGIRDITKEL